MIRSISCNWDGVNFIVKFGYETLPDFNILEFGNVET